jgi:hypothetical protein
MQSYINVDRENNDLHYWKLRNFSTTAEMEKVVLETHCEIFQEISA